MSVDQPFNIYREQLSSLYHGLALWDPKPVENLHKRPGGRVSIGDVGYLYNGAFMRMFNVTLPWNDPLNKLLGTPEKYERIKPCHSGNVLDNEIREGEYCTPHVSKVDHVGAVTHEDYLGNMYQCRAQHRGALLYLPQKGHRKDVIPLKVFENYIRDNVDNWFRWSRTMMLPVENMEELILVTGCTLVTSWAAAAFDGHMSVDLDAMPTISLELRKPDGGGTQFFWRNNRGNVEYHNNHFDPNVRKPPPQNQCVFIRGFRAKRFFFRTRAMRAEAEPLPDDPDDSREDEIQVTRIPDGSKYRDPLAGVLDYIVEKCREDVTAAEDIIAIAHDDDLRFIEGVETLTADAVENFLREKKVPLLIENGGAILRDRVDNGPTVSDDNFTAIFDAALNEYKAFTKQDLQTHPFAAAFEKSDSPNSVMNVFQKQAQAFDKFRKGDDKLMAWLTPIVNILFTFSGSLGEGVGLTFSPAKTLFTGIGVLLGAVRDVIASYEALVNLFERIQFFLQRLHHHTSAPLTPEMTELLAKIMAQILSILALSTKTMKERRIKKFMKRLMGKTEVEDALQRLDMLTQEENLITVARTLEATHDVNVNVKATQELTHHVDNKVTVTEEDLQHVDGNIMVTQDLIYDVRADVDVIKEGTRSVVDDNIKVATREIDEIQRNLSRAVLREWLAPPNPSINHYTAYNTKHDGTANWFIQGRTFDEWKTNGSLLWIRGNPGSGKSILCSAIIEEIRHIRKSISALVAYYYFDFKDAAKRDVRGLLTSLLLQLVDDSDPCWDLLFQLHKTCRNGSEQPSEAALTQCLSSMFDLPGQIPIYIIIDALDECPNNIETPSARERVLDFVEGLVKSEHSNLFICVTSRPEQDINTALNPLTPPSLSISLHEEGGQTEDINNFVRSFVMNDRTMRRWRAEDKELVIRELSERAQGVFHWVHCQLDTLHRCMPSSIRKALNELPITLDDTYGRILQGIPKEKFQHARRLFQCIVAAIRPLRVEELAEILAIKFGPDEVTYLVEGWRLENAEEAVLSVCSSLVRIIDDQGSKIVQFSHFSVKEYMTSDRLQTSYIGHVRDYYTPLEQAHTLLARACIAVLLQLNKNVFSEQVATLPLAGYASEHWLDHAKFKNVQSQIQDALEHLFDPNWPHLRTCIWLHNVELKYPYGSDDYSVAEQPPPREATALYYAVFCGFIRLAEWLITTHAEDVNAKCYDDRTPLHIASREGHVDAVRLLLGHGAHVNSQDRDGWMPLHFASHEGNLEVVRLLLNHGANMDAQSFYGNSPVWLASRSGFKEVVRLLGDYGADVSPAFTEFDHSPGGYSDKTS